MQYSTIEVLHFNLHHYLKRISYLHQAKRDAIPIELLLSLGLCFQTRIGGCDIFHRGEDIR